MDDPFHRLLDSLSRPALPADLPRLFELSDLDQAQFVQFVDAWRQIPDAQRLALIASLGQLATDHIELNFDGIHRHALDDPAAPVRQAAIGNLWESEDPSLIPPFLRAVTLDPEPGVRAAAAAALGQFVYLGEVGRLGEAQLRELEQTLLDVLERETVDDVRLRALESIGFSSREEVPPLILDAFASDREEVRRAALVAMGRSANNLWNAQVLSQLDSPSPALRLEAVRAAGELEIRGSVGSLIDLLEDGNEAIPPAAVWSLGQIGGARAQKALTGLVDRVEPEAEASLLEDALDHLAFVDGMSDLEVLDVPDDEAD